MRGEEQAGAGAQDDRQRADPQRAIGGAVHQAEYRFFVDDASGVQRWAAWHVDADGRGAIAPAVGGEVEQQLVAAGWPTSAQGGEEAAPNRRAQAVRGEYRAIAGGAPLGRRREHDAIAGEQEELRRQALFAAGEGGAQAVEIEIDADHGQQRPIVGENGFSAGDARALRGGEDVRLRPGAAAGGCGQAVPRPLARIEAARRFDQRIAQRAIAGDAAAAAFGAAIGLRRDAAEIPAAGIGFHAEEGAVGQGDVRLRHARPTGGVADQRARHQGIVIEARAHRHARTQRVEQRIGLAEHVARARRRRHRLHPERRLGLAAHAVVHQRLRGQHDAEAGERHEQGDDDRHAGGRGEEARSRRGRRQCRRHGLRCENREFFRGHGRPG